jgi:uncharacterized protein (TIGR04141 family)
MTQNPKIYRIDRNHRLLKGIVSTEEKIKKIIISHYQKLGLNPNKASLSIKSFTKDEVIYYLYHYNTNETISDWHEFLPDELTEGADFKQQQLSLLLFAETKIDIYCIIGGLAYQMIIPFIDHSFGLNTYSRIMKPEFDQLASIKSRGITGLRAGINELFRDNYKIIDFIKFGKIPQEIHLTLSTEITDLHFSFLKSKPSELVQIYVGKGFKIKKPVDFENLHKIILELNTISELAPSDYLSSYKEIRDNKFIDDFLKAELINKIYNDIGGLGKRENPSLSRFEHDFCNPNDMEKFYEADSYHLKELTSKKGYNIFKIVNDRREIYDSVLQRAVELYGDNDRFNFMVYLQGVRVTCVQNNKATIGSNFLFHITTEFTINDKPYFLVDTKWYNLRNSFVSDLKTNAVHILKTYKASDHILYLPWDKGEISREGEYNLKYNGINNYFVIDTIIVDGLELCDLIYYDNNTLYLIHVKYGFSSKIRELNNQINISARRLKDVLGTNEKSILVKIYDQLIEKNRFHNNLSLEEFLKLFEKRIVFIMAFTSHLKDDILIEDNIEKFDSNIARFSLVQCSSELRSNYFDMLTYQIKRG